jgi:autotransporter translocation and assembly factor TamB
MAISLPIAIMFVLIVLIVLALVWFAVTEAGRETAIQIARSIVDFINKFVAGWR